MSARAVAVPIRPQPKMTMSSIVLRAGVSSRLHSLAASGEPITTILSPGRIVSSPRGMAISSSRMMLATFESAGRTASFSAGPTTRSNRSSAATGFSTSNSTICTCPSAKTSVWRAAGTPIVWDTASAVSRSDETTQSTSSCRSRQTSRYSSFPVRTMVRASGASLRANIETMTLTSSREVHAITSAASLSPACSSTFRLAPSPSTVPTSYRLPSASRRAASVSITVSSCSLWSASTIVKPTCPAPMTKILIARPRLTPPPAGSQA